jgi:GT2 family glycosyltransferase
VAVVVAYNRRPLLVDALNAIAGQTRPPDALLVVDNASSDGSAETAAAHPAVTNVLTLTANLGGAGGFAAGIAQALVALQAEAVWVMDDDAAPSRDALAELERVWELYPGRLAAASSRVVWTDGRDHPMNSQRSRLFASRDRRWRARQVGARPIRTGSFVSMLISAQAVRTHGLPIADYFIWNDDLEYSARLLRKGHGIAVPSSVVVHQTKDLSSSLSNPGERFYYEVRNKLWAFLKSSAFGPFDMVCYSAYTLAAWLRLFCRAAGRGQLSELLVGLRSGFRDGLLKRPRLTSRVLTEQQSVAQAAAMIERGAARRLMARRFRGPAA